MRTKVLFHYLCEHSNRMKKKNIEIEHCENVTAIQHLDQIDKSEIMANHGRSIVFDYSVSPKKKEKTCFRDYVLSLRLSDAVMLEFMAVYSFIKDDLKGKSNEFKASQVFSHMNLAMNASKNAYEHTTLLIKSIDQSVKQLKDHNDLHRPPLPNHTEEPRKVHGR